MPSININSQIAQYRDIQQEVFHLPFPVVYSI